MDHLVNKKVETDQTPHLAASDLGLHCLPMCHKKDSRLNGLINSTILEHLCKILYK